MTARFDRQLPLADRIALRLHLFACKACPGFERQVRLMDQAMGRWRSYMERE
ncbi:zf-HC2 domain-containing protein [Methylibium sp.]|uniref:zf-HC2 domain-containing protein n=1 Tax=Methylibium sp. TaxID=2067992 RepID=UPI00286CC47A|nr:zf-HC2 domain-containing protein [Methylibium sp.]